MVYKTLNILAYLVGTEISVTGFFVKTNIVFPFLFTKEEVEKKENYYFLNLGNQ